MPPTHWPGYAHYMELKFFNPWADIETARNRLPHWHQLGATVFITFRLADSLPAGLLAQWRDERETWLKWNPPPWTDAQEREYHDRFTGAVERWLDEGHGQCLLRRPPVRDAVAAVLTRFDHTRYWHHAWVLMPNHFHVLITLDEGIALGELVKVWKGASSRAATQAGCDAGTFWQKDYFDRLVRDREHFRRCARYIRRNPENLRTSDYTLYLSEETRAAIEV